MRGEHQGDNSLEGFAICADGVDLIAAVSLLFPVCFSTRMGIGKERGNGGLEGRHEVLVCSKGLKPEAEGGPRPDKHD